MKTTIDYEGKTIRLYISPAAEQQLNALENPLCAEMELYFSCLIRKKLRFNYHCAEENCVKINDKLFLRFHPIMTQVCGKEYQGDEPPTTDFPIVKKGPYIPHWLKIEYLAGGWQGDFGYN